MGTEPIAYAYDAALHCPRDAAASGRDLTGSHYTEHGHTRDSDPSPVYYWNETDSPDSCDDCGEYIPTAWTREAVAYVREALDNGGIPDEWVETARAYGIAI